jgi:crotonobetainyl-CoA:carnitine CoA-transferase CaiB-like acyl-CoA transferase
VLRDPAVVDNGYVMSHPTEPRLRLSAAPAQFDDELPSIRRPGPRKGEHSRDILAEVGYSADEIDALVATGVVIAP